MSIDLTKHLTNEGAALVLHGENGLTDQDLGQLARLPDRTRSKIRSLVLSRTPLTDAGLRHLSALPNLRNLYLQGTAITDDAPFELCAKGLEVVVLDDTSVGDRAVGALGSAGKLRLLSVKNTRVSDRGIHRLTGSTTLSEYHLTGTAVTFYGKRRLDNALYRWDLSCLVRWVAYQFHTRFPRFDVSLCRG